MSLLKFYKQYSKKKKKSNNSRLKKELQSIISPASTQSMQQEVRKQKV